MEKGRQALRTYAASGHRTVEGWVDPLDVQILLAVYAVQEDLGVSGGVGEIGVHHGRLFILLAHMRAAGETALAVDVFEDQVFNVDRSGRGDRLRFEQNLFAHGVQRAGLRILAADSTSLKPEDLDRESARGFRLFSVDGSHTAGATLSDLRLAAHGCGERGVVILDDHFNKAWPGVSEGLGRYQLTTESPLAPFLIGGNKVLLAHPTVASTYRAALELKFGRRLMTTPGRFYGSDVIIVGWKKTRPLWKRGLSLVRRQVSSRLNR